MTRPTDVEILEAIKRKRAREHEIVHAIVMKDKGITQLGGNHETRKSSESTRNGAQSFSK